MIPDSLLVPNHAPEPIMQMIMIRAQNPLPVWIRKLIPVLSPTSEMIVIMIPALLLNVRLVPESIEEFGSDFDPDSESDSEYDPYSEYDSSPEFDSKFRF